MRSWRSGRRRPARPRRLGPRMAPGGGRPRRMGRRRGHRRPETGALPLHGLPMGRSTAAGDGRPSCGVRPSSPRRSTPPWPSSARRMRPWRPWPQRPLLRRRWPPSAPSHRGRWGSGRRTRRYGPWWPSVSRPASPVTLTPPIGCATSCPSSAWHSTTRLRAGARQTAGRGRSRLSTCPNCTRSRRRVRAPPRSTKPRSPASSASASRRATRATTRRPTGCATSSRSTACIWTPRRASGRRPTGGRGPSCPSTSRPRTRRRPHAPVRRASPRTRCRRSWCSASRRGRGATTRRPTCCAISWRGTAST
mmetsp:Transcript_35829/g.114127  ORF Transcript_35829/g.114127 Transcript_35829/m.114127 type:complete len:307 (+) Transcript_35829:1580-2500(+)